MPLASAYRVLIVLLLSLLIGVAGCSSPDSAEKPTAEAADDSTAGPTVQRIAFGSCNDQNRPQLLWEPIRAGKPDLWIWLGDNIYADTEDMSKMRSDYERQRRRPGYTALRESTIVIGTWDDHDYGVNDGDRTYAKRDSSQQLFLDFLDVPGDDPRRDRAGVYAAHTYGPPDQRVKVILLDTRYHRDPLTRVNTPERLYLPDTTASLLGEEQWQWLERELRTSDAELTLIGTSIQAVGTEHRWEKWADVPAERERLFDTIRRSGTPGVILISGDRHRGELSRHDDAVGYPLYELTASGMTHATPAPGETNRHRLGSLVEVLHFGRIDVAFDAPTPHVVLELRGRDNEVLLEHRVDLHTLHAQDATGDGERQNFEPAAKISRDAPEEGTAR
ncbi:alkaline phosphatase D family protein [Longibacter sp.]|uniref:alkaline phosphatase D family protein n=1 Tax=Longibacter sp. TaxID=2045415 RepID=UPI003EBF5002